MEYTTVKNLTWSNPEHTQFHCDVFFVRFNQEMPFACDQSEVGVYPHVTSIWERALAGEFGSIAEYQDPALANPPQSTLSVGAQTL